MTSRLFTPVFSVLFLTTSLSFAANPKICLKIFGSQAQLTERVPNPSMTQVLQLPPTVPRILFDRALPTAKNIRELQTLKLLEFNVLNFFLRHESFLAENQSQDKPKEQLEGVARIIKKADPDLMVLVEVDNLNALKVFDQEYLGSTYRSLLLEGNDNRGIDIGLYVKNDLPIDIEFRSMSYVKDGPEGGGAPIFSRDLPIYLLREAGKKDAAPIMAVLGTHYKSMRGGNTDPMGSEKRTRQALATAKIIKDLQKEFGKDLQIVLTGDFNNDVRNPQEFGSLYETGMQEALQFTGQPSQPTHAYFQPNGTPDPKQIDGVLLNEALQKSGAVASVEILPHLDVNGDPLPFPKSFAERERRPSDHVPSLITFNFKKLYKAVRTLF